MPKQSYLDIAIKELFEFYEEAAKAYEDSRLTVIEVARIYPEFKDFTKSVKYADEICGEWELLDKSAKFKAIEKFSTNTKRQFSKVKVKLYVSLFEDITMSLLSIQSAFKTINKINQLDKQ